MGLEIGISMGELFSTVRPYKNGHFSVNWRFEDHFKNLLFRVEDTICSDTRCQYRAFYINFARKSV